MNIEEDLIYSPKKNWHDKKKWNEGIHTRRSVVRWVSNDEDLTYTETGTPLLTYPCIRYENGERQWIYDTVPIRSAANIEKHWFKKLRYRNGGTRITSSTLIPFGKSSRNGMKEKAQWWEEVGKYLNEKNSGLDIAA